MPKITVHGGASNAAGFVKVHGGTILPTVVEPEVFAAEPEPERPVAREAVLAPEPTVSRETAPRGRRRKG